MDAKRLSIALLSHVASAQAPTGAERSLALLASSLRRRGHRVEVVAAGPWSLATELAEAGVPVRPIATRPCWLAYHDPRPSPEVAARWLRWARPPRGERALRAWLEHFAPDVVHVNCLPHLSGARAASASGRPVVWHLREILPPGARRRWWGRELGRHATRLVAVSEAVGDWVRQEGLGDRLDVIPNGVAPYSVARRNGSARSKLDLPADGVLVGLYGQLVPHKGALPFVQAAARAMQAEPGLRFAVAGSGPPEFRRRVERAALDAGLGGALRVLPPQPGGEALLEATDIVCLATTTPDPFPRIVLEAMAHGRPVAAFRSGGTAEMVLDGETGLLVDTGDVEALAAAFVRLARDAGLRETLGRAALRRVRERFTLERHVDTMEALFRGLAR